jgi:hypothetical protein
MLREKSDILLRSRPTSTAKPNAQEKRETPGCCGRAFHSNLKMRSDEASGLHRLGQEPLERLDRVRSEGGVECAHLAGLAH